MPIVVWWQDSKLMATAVAGAAVQAAKREALKLKVGPLDSQ